MDLSELHRVQRQERATDSLQELRESFYADVAAYLESLREKRADAAAEAVDPFRSDRVSELTREIETAEHVVEAIYQRRIGKLVDEATLTATGNGGGADGLTAEERDLYEDLVDRIQENQQTVLETVAGDRSPAATPTDSTDTDTSETEPDTETDSDSERVPPDPPSGDIETSPAAVMGPDSNSESDGPEDEGAEDAAGGEAETTSDGDGVERRTVRVTSEVGEIFGVDAEEYELHPSDVVDLPRENADPLVERDAAERVE
ncbi:hypothetical protein HTSR_0565 [Halodesulfurarchaeum formicicum]|uniref:DNA replication factor GINS n=1 Tax=Halodesulfurarchaeum formicicum TaxID=1873524 RepID=A0A1D8S323_9EURY|nr:hypothetical protein [Halodesulfurarchaeum formicicum]AOW79760.1 hypothetical protein HTSR_0565 [Halodesulfurarchaeum formicicum]